MLTPDTAFASLVFGYFFYWTIHDDFTAGIAGPGAAWPLTALALFALAWAAMLGARRSNDRDRRQATRACLAAAFALASGGAVAGFLGSWSHGMTPSAHVYPAMVWVLVIWTLAHAVIGGLMQLYCLARSLAGRLTGRHDMDLCNAVLYWHFMLGTAIVAFAVVGLFPLALGDGG